MNNRHTYSNISRVHVLLSIASVTVKAICTAAAWRLTFLVERHQRLGNRLPYRCATQTQMLHDIIGSQGMTSGGIWMDRFICGVGSRPLPSSSRGVYTEL